MTSLSESNDIGAALPERRSKTGYFEWLFKTASEGVLVLDAETGNILDANPFLLNLLESTLDAIAGRHFSELGSENDVEALKLQFIRMQKVDRSRYSEISLQTSTGRRREVEFVSNAYRVDGTFVIQCNIRDVTEHRRLERLARAQVAELARSRAEKAELARSNAELEQFSYIASHDLQEPLRAIAGCVQLLQDRYSDQLDERANEIISHAMEGTKRMETLIRDLLAYSRVGADDRPRQEVDCAALVQGVIPTLAASIAESSARIDVDSLPTVFGDPVQLSQLFQNLIGNAIKFRAAERPLEIRVAARSEPEEWQFSILDNGIGIGEGKDSRIFRLFQRLHPRRQYSGNGIGLAICRRIVEGHGGRIWVDSTPGAGSTFQFTLPKMS